MDTVSNFKYDGRCRKYIFWCDVNKLIDKLAKWVKENCENIKNVYGVPRAGIIMAVILSYKLNIPWIHDEKDITNDTIIIDDCEDKGNTVKNFKNKYPNNKFIVLYSKRNKKTVSDYYAENCDENIWLDFPYE